MLRSFKKYLLQISEYLYFLISRLYKLFLKTITISPYLFEDVMITGFLKLDLKIKWVHIKNHFFC